MTSPAPTENLFRSAVSAVQQFPLELWRRPAFALPKAPSRSPRHAPGDVAGVPGDIWTTRQALARRETSVTEIVESASSRTADHSKRLGAFEYVADVAAWAAELERELDVGAPRGPLHGIPFSVKDIIDVGGMPTTGSSRALTPWTAERDATAVRRLREAGAVMMGKTVTHEFALGVTTPQSRNPWDETRVPGGSSGGSAISVVTGMALGSLGTDTRASIRVPAALAGVVGFRATTGLVPVDGWIPLSWSMDVLAPMARSVRDIALLMDVLTDSGTTFVDVLPGTITGCTIGYSDGLWAGIEPGVRACFEAAMAAAERGGARVVRCDGLSAEDVELSNYAGMVLSRAEAAHFHADAGTDLSLCSPEVREQLSEASGVSAGEYLRCLRIRDVLYQRFTFLFEDVDLLLLPTSEVVAPRVEDADQYLLVLSENCIPWSFVGFPAISLFSGLSEGLPTGVQIVAPAGQDAYLLAAAHALERELPPPPEWRP